MNIQEPLMRLKRISAGLDLDLNVPPTSDNLDLNAIPTPDILDQDGTSNQVRSLDGQSTQGRNTTVPEPIDLDAIDDDDVIISSPRAFAEAKKNPKRYQGCIVVSEVVDVETAEMFRAKKRRVPALNRNLSKNVESCNTTSSGKSAVLPLKPPEEPSFSCPVCMGPLVEEMSTKCGHIFCKGCIETAIAAQSKCPTCRKKITLKDLIRIYLPATSVC